MPYTANIDRRNPGCFLFLVDQSLSMSNPLAGQREQPKMNAATDAVNRTIDNIAQRCSQGMDIRDYFDIGVLGYGYRAEMPYHEIVALEYINYYDGSEHLVQRIRGREYDPRRHKPVYREMVISALPGTSPESPFLPISDVADLAEMEERRVREMDATERLVEVTRRFPVWLRPHAGIGTPMRRALTHAASAIEGWIAQHPDSFPPIVINISDGESSDGDPSPVARHITDLRTRDGNVLVFNCHLSERTAAPIQYPERENGLPDDFARQMFQMSSVLPPTFLQHVSSLGIPAGALSRCFVFNADMVSLVQFLDIGTRGPSNLQ